MIRPPAIFRIVFTELASLILVAAGPKLALTLPASPSPRPTSSSDTRSSTILCLEDRSDAVTGRATGGER